MLRKTTGKHQRCFVAVLAFFVLSSLLYPHESLASEWEDSNSAATAPALPALAPTASGAPSEGRVKTTVRELPLDDLSTALERGRISEPRYALARARSIYRLSAVRARYGSVVNPDPRDSSMILRDLNARLHQMPTKLRESSLAILARPTDGTSDPQNHGYEMPTSARYNCSRHMCFHWVDETSDAPRKVDANDNGIPDQVEKTKRVFEHVWATEIGTMGYRPPKTDVNSLNPGPNPKLDVYLADVGSHGEFGYCVSDDQNDPHINPASSYEYGDFAVYCVVDNDFGSRQFPEISGSPALKVTAAHEFFHAVQCAYDCYEDRWLAEGTATWIEDEVYDRVNENHRYLRSSALSRPDVPVDLGRNGFQYGAWVFWRFLSEYSSWPEGDERGPSVVREVWQVADASPYRLYQRDLYSMVALSVVLDDREVRLGDVFVDFTSANLVPQRFYEEGHTYPHAPTWTRKLTSSSRTVSTTAVLDHLSAQHFMFRPANGIGRTAELELRVRSATNGLTRTAVIVKLESGAFRRFDLAAINDDSRGRFPFGKGRVRWVTLVVSNTDARMDCAWETTLSCGGYAVSDDRAHDIQARVVE